MYVMERSGQNSINTLVYRNEFISLILLSFEWTSIVTKYKLSFAQHSQVINSNKENEDCIRRFRDRFVGPGKNAENDLFVECGIVKSMSYCFRFPSPRSGLPTRMLVMPSFSLDLTNTFHLLHPENVCNYYKWVHYKFIQYNSAQCRERVRQ